MVISSSTMVRSRPPTRYFTQSGIVGGDGAGGDGGGGGSGGDNDADDNFAGDDDSEGGVSVVKAPTALQLLWVLDPIALTFQ